MTDNEIIKALECCSKDRALTTKDCMHGCPYFNVLDCRRHCMRDALDLINRLKAEIERLKQERDKEHHYCHHYARMCAKVKSEARKEFAEQLEAEIISSDKYIREYDDSKVQKAYNKGLRDALKILKEMG